MNSAAEGVDHTSPLKSVLDYARSLLFGSTTLLPIATVCLVYSWNVDRVPFGGFVNALVVMCFLSVAFTLILKFVTPSRIAEKTLANAFFTGSVIGSYFIAGLEAVWFVVWLAVCAVVVVSPAKSEVIRSLISAITIAMLCLAVFNLIMNSTFLEETGDPPPYHQAFESLPQSGSGSDEKRDVYYIVLDRYARSDQLANVYGFDNSNFINALKSRGFLVAEKSYSNYQRTAHSLSSSLNMMLLDTAGNDDVPGRNWLPIYRSIETSAVVQFFKGEGYDFQFLGSWWEPTRANRLADNTINYRAWPELIRIMFENSIFGTLADQFEIASINPRQLQCERAKTKFDALRSLAGSTKDRSNFVFAHFLVPHPPFVLDADGSCLSIAEAKSRTREENYVNQVRYANSELLKFLDAIEESDDPKPVVILQADEGPWPKKYVQDEIHFLGRDVTNVDWTTVTPSELREKMGILNALYLPDRPGLTISETQSPVNNFRLVLREYFDADMNLLPDDAYIFPNNSDIYRFENVNQKLEQE